MGQKMYFHCDEKNFFGNIDWEHFCHGDLMNGLRMLSWTCLRAGWPESCYFIYFLKIVVGVAVRPSPLISCYVTRAILDSALSES